MIIQGTNEPIKLTFSTLDISTITDMSVVLCKHSTTAISSTVNIVKHWSLSDLTADTEKNQFLCPLTQQETMLFAPGTLSLEIKWIAGGNVQFTTIPEITVQARCDETILGGDS